MHLFVFFGLCFSMFICLVIISPGKPDTFKDETEIFWKAAFQKRFLFRLAG
jgi:hypothetical protein